MLMKKNLTMNITKLEGVKNSFSMAAEGVFFSFTFVHLNETFIKLFIYFFIRLNTDISKVHFRIFILFFLFCRFRILGLNNKFRNFMKVINFFIRNVY